MCILWQENCAVSVIYGTLPYFLYGLVFFNIPLFYFYNFKCKIQSRTPKFSVLISHSFMVYSWAGNLIAYGFNFFMSKVGICLIQTF